MQGIPGNLVKMLANIPGREFERRVRAGQLTLLCKYLDIAPRKLTKAVRSHPDRHWR